MWSHAKVLIVMGTGATKLLWGKFWFLDEEKKKPHKNVSYTVMSYKQIRQLRLHTCMQK